MITRPRKAFTLLELMVAFIIMAILTAVAVPSLAGIVGNDTLTGHQASAIAQADAASLNAFSGGDLTPMTVAQYTAAGTIAFTLASGHPTAFGGTVCVALVSAGATPTLC